MTALDELRQGRFLEVADILASRARALAYHAEGGAWKVAREFLTYVEGSHSLVSEATEDAAARFVQKREKCDRRDLWEIGEDAIFDECFLLACSLAHWEVCSMQWLSPAEQCQHHSEHYKFHDILEIRGK